jgi:hypothetical protein
MSQKAALRVDDPRFAGDDAPPAADRAPFGADGPHVLGDGAGEIGLGFDCRIAHAGGEQRMGGAAGRAVAHGELAKRLDPEAARRLALAAEALEEG